MLQLFSLLSFLCLTLCNGQKDLNFTASSITREQIMSRAQVWVDQKVPYSQTQTKDGYRQDCSGYVSEKVLWPDRFTGELNYPKELKKGSVVQLIVRKSHGYDQVSVEKILIESNPLT